MHMDSSSGSSLDNAVTEPEKRASNPLVAAALAGLLGVGMATACGSDGNGNVDSSGNTGGRNSAGGSSSSGGESNADSGPEIYSRVLSTTPIAIEDFSETCRERGGFVTTHAYCAGSNLCKGLSYADDGTTLTDHSCKAMNSCAGFSCVDLPEDSGLSGEEIYEAGPCAGCHNNAGRGASNYIIFVKPGADMAAALENFNDSSDLRLHTIVAFGTQGVNPDGTGFSNMPAYREKYSRAEIERVVEYLRGLEHPVKEYSGHGK